ncbi:MAG: hypothetical protein QF491_20535, partial [Alphaproteobacteria bacterium]|nr:hypothetical protein [Alphaproteobacteria bacterium]
MYRRAFLYGLFGIFAAVLSGFLSLSAALAAPVTVPTELSPGEQYRLAFVTSTLRDARSRSASPRSSGETRGSFRERFHQILSTLIAPAVSPAA